jgi:dTDP-4-amino-4,6-dideoxygalactose transaminase
MLALRALEIGPGDSVVVPAFGCAATVFPVIECGARVVFAEVDSQTFNLTWETISAALRPDTKGVILVHMFGWMAQVETIARECKRRKLHLVEDTALALGARRAGRFAGTFGVAGCFSFHPRKIVTTGEGGAICTADPELAARARAARNYGAAQTAWARFRSGDGSPRGFARLGFNCKLTDLQAAVGLTQLKRLAQFLSRRAQIARYYASRLSGCQRFLLPSLPATPREHVFQAYVCVCSPEPLAEISRRPARLAAAERSLQILKESLARDRVAVSDAAQFLPALPIFGRHRRSKAFLHAQAAALLAFAIPIYPSMTDEQIDRVVDSLLRAGQRAGV